MTLSAAAKFETSSGFIDSPDGYAYRPPEPARISPETSSTVDVTEAGEAALDADTAVPPVEAPLRTDPEKPEPVLRDREDGVVGEPVFGSEAVDEERRPARPVPLGVGEARLGVPEERHEQQRQEAFGVHDVGERRGKHTGAPPRSPGPDPALG